MDSSARKTETLKIAQGGAFSRAFQSVAAWCAIGLRSPGRLAPKVRADLRDWRDELRLARSGLFDPQWYRSAYPDVAARADALHHFVAQGASELRKPNPLFDSRWYADRYPDVMRHGQNPLLHYLMSGAGEGRDPNPYFSSSWYIAANPEVAQSGLNPLAHYLAHGDRRRPSARFDSGWYLDHYPEVQRLGLNPLAHFLTHGLAQGYAPNPNEHAEGRGVPVDQADIVALKPMLPVKGREAALLVTHSPHGRLKPHVAHYLQALHREGVAVVLIVAADVAFEPDAAPMDELHGLYIRENKGFDFAAWAHMLALEPGLFDAAMLMLLNDSVIGPVNSSSFRNALTKVRASDADLVALTDSRERGWHLQSYFLALKPGALRNARFQAWWSRVRMLADKQDVIDAYELTLASQAIEAGLACEAVFRSGNIVNATVFDWQGLLQDGFPFVKALVLKGFYDQVDISDWRTVLTRAGFDVAIAEATLKPLRIRLTAQPPTPGPLRKLAFYGPWNYANGLGVASRNYLSALWRLDTPLDLRPIKKPFHIHRRTALARDVDDFADPADAAIVHLNPDSWFLLTEAERAAIDRARFRIGLWVWEMSHIPDFYRKDFGAVDAIWTPSRYCADVFAAETDRPVHVIPHVVPLPPPLQRQARPLDELGIGADERIVLYAFDGSSYIARKNPSALVEAFARSGLGDRGWRLVLKTKNLMDSPEQGLGLAEQAQHAGATLIDRSLSREAMSALFARADIYASPHCSEGFGLTIAEAMAAGKSVVATDYGGSRDFLDATCGFPVQAEIKTLTQSYGHYRAGGQWAQVDVNALAHALSEAAARIEGGDHGLGDKARARVAERLSPDAVAAAMRDSLNRLASLSPTCKAAT